MTAFVKDQMWTDVASTWRSREPQVDVASMYDVEQYKPGLSLIWSLKAYKSPITGQVKKLMKTKRKSFSAVGGEYQGARS
jgi:hypothetical protein